MPRSMRAPAADTVSLLTSPHHSNISPSVEDRQAELEAAFGSDDEDDDYRHRARAGDESADEMRIDVPLSPVATAPGDVFFDAGEALQTDPLGATRSANDSTVVSPATMGNAPPYTLTPAQIPRPTFGTNELGSGPHSETYDFEGASYFTPNRPHPSRTNSVNVSRVGSPRLQDRMETGNVGGDSVRAQDANQTSISRVRLALGRFGRLVGMRVPGATYSTLNTDDEGSAQLPRTSARGVMGGGMGQDGVFANMNAKPERRRRREGGDDRGEDDDLVDDVLPPTYETAAADVAPPYWETTIIGGPGGLHPLAPGGMGWTPGGAHVGAIEDLIVEGLPVGNFFGFAWNLLVSMSFQFVGFLLTYLLHTTHAARCGSRAGLGITLVQYGFYLRTRAMQIAEGKMPDDGLSPLPTGTEEAATPSAHSVWWTTVGKAPEIEQSAREWVSRGLSIVIRQTLSSSASPNITIPAGNTTTLADILAADDGGLAVPSTESMSASTEWLAYILMGIGWFILLSSVLSYWRVHRWGRQLVEAARRESDGDADANGEAANADSSQQDRPVGFLHTLRHVLSSRSSRSDRRPQHSAEDWIIFPGRHRSESLLRDSPSGAGNGDERLINSMRNVGLLA